MENKLVFDNMLFMSLIIALLGIVMVIVIAVKTSGIGPFTLQAYGITLIGVIVAVLGLMMKEATPVATAAMGILGAIAGYLFGIKK